MTFIAINAFAVESDEGSIYMVRTHEHDAVNDVRGNGGKYHDAVVCDRKQFDAYRRAWERQEILAADESLEKMRSKHEGLGLSEIDCDDLINRVKLQIASIRELEVDNQFLRDTLAEAEEA